MAKKCRILLPLLLWALLICGCAPAQTEPPTAEPTQPARTAFDYDLLPMESNDLSVLAQERGTLWLERDQEGSAVAVTILGRIPLNSAALSKTDLKADETLLLAVADGTFTRSDGSPQTLRFYIPILQTTRGIRCLPALTDSEIARLWTDASMGDPYTTACAARWEDYASRWQRGWLPLWEPEYFILKGSSGNNLRNMKVLFDDRLPSPRNVQHSLTDLRSGERIPIEEAKRALFQFYGESKLQLDWENATADGAGLYADSSLCLRIGHQDGSWYIELHDGADANWIYISECRLYVPMRTRTYEQAAEYINRRLVEDHQHYLWYAPYFETLGNLDAEQTVQKYLDAVLEAQRRAGREDLSGTLVYEDVSLERSNWTLEGNKLRIEYTLRYIPKEGQPVYIGHYEKPNRETCGHHIRLIRGEDGFWRRDTGW